MKKLIQLATVQALTALSRTSIYTIHDFPKPVKIGGAGSCAQGGARWIESEIHDWIEGRIAARDQAFIANGK